MRGWILARGANSRIYGISITDRSKIGSVRHFYIQLQWIQIKISSLLHSLWGWIGLVIQSFTRLGILSVPHNYRSRSVTGGLQVWYL